MINENNKKEIFWNLINSGLAGTLVLLGSLTNGSLTIQGISIAIVASLIVAVTQFKDYWTNEKHEYSNNKLFSFIKL